MAQASGANAANNESAFNFGLNNSSSTSSVMTAALNHLNQQLLQQRNASGFMDASSASNLLNESLKKSKAELNEASKLNLQLSNALTGDYDEAEQENNQNHQEDEVNDDEDDENEDNDEENDEDEDDFEDRDDTDDVEDEDEDENEAKHTKKHRMSSHSSSSKSKLANKPANSQYSPVSLMSGSVIQSGTIKIEQNEKMIKKNKVIELYTKGERCVRKLSQLTGVPLTTVYRVIGKLKGINYNIPRGNGAGRKTILDSQDREILVEILNAQPRISRKALGKELEKRTGKSIHNSTLNRELCRLRHHGHTFAAVTAAASSSHNLDANNSALSPPYTKLNEPPTHSNNYLKHFNTNRKNNSLSTSVYNSNSLGSTKQNKQVTNVNANKAEKRSLPLGNNKPSIDGSKSSNQLTLDNEYVKLIAAETKRFCSVLTQSDIECKPVINMRPDLSKHIIEICQMSTTHSSTSPVVLQARLEKIQQVVVILLQEQAALNNTEIGKSFYDLCLSEACVQIAQIKPTLLTRSEDLMAYARRILEACRIVEESKSRSSKRVLTGSQNDSLPSSKHIKLEGEYDQQKNQNLLANNFSTQLYTAALALQLQQPNQIGNNMPDLKAYLNKLPFFQSQLNSANASNSNSNSQSSILSNNNKAQLKQKIYLNEQQIQQNTKYQDDLKTKLFILNASLNEGDKSIGSNSNNEQFKNLIEQIQIQLNEAIKKQNDLINEQIKLKKEELNIGNRAHNENDNDNDDDEMDPKYRFKASNENNSKDIIETGSKLNDNYNDENDENNEEDNGAELNRNKYSKNGAELSFKFNKNYEQRNDVDDDNDDEEDYSDTEN